MKWLFFMLGSAGLLAGAGCASQQQPYSYYPNGYTPPAVASTTYAQPQYYAQPAQPQYYAQPGAVTAPSTPPVQTAPLAQAQTTTVVQPAAPMTQPVIYQAPPQGYQMPQQAYQVPQQACLQCAPCQCQ